MNEVVDSSFVDLKIDVRRVENGQSVIIPFKYYQSLIMISATVNGKKGDFILDTGANKLVLNSNHFEFRKTKSVSTAYGVGGELEEFGKLNVDTFSTEELLIRKLKAEVINLEAIEQKKNTKILGLIGYEVLEPYELLLNYQERFITLTRLDKSGNRIITLPYMKERLDSFSFVMGNHIPVLKVALDGKSKWMALDTGAEYNLLDIKKNRRSLKSFDIKGRIELTGADGKSIEALGGVLYRVVLGEKYRCGGMSTILTNLDNLEKIYGTELDGILGHGFFAPWIISINYRKKMIYIHPLKNMRV